MTATLDDPARLDALERSGLRDKSRQERVDHLTFTVAQLVRADAAQLNVLGAEWQWTIAQWPSPPADPTDPKQTGCHQVVTEERTIAILDTVLDPVTCVMPWVTAYRGYLGTPLMFDEHPVGALCVLSVQPRTWRAHDVMALEAVASLVILSLVAE